MSEFRNAGPILVRIGRRLRGTFRDPLLAWRARRMADALRCPGLLEVDPRNVEPGWLGWPTTPGEKKVIEFLSRIASSGKPRILHVGIGTGELGRSLTALGAEVIGLSIDGGEIANAGTAYRSTHLVNKYALPDLALALRDAKFDLIVDVNLFSYTCCWGHAMRYVWFLGDLLADGGRIVSHTSGARYAPTGHVLTPSLLARLASLSRFHIVTDAQGVILLARSD